MAFPSLAVSLLASSHGAGSTAVAPAVPSALSTGLDSAVTSPLAFALGTTPVRNAREVGGGVVGGVVARVCGEVGGVGRGPGRREARGRVVHGVRVGVPVVGVRIVGVLVGRAGDVARRGGGAGRRGLLSEL